MKRFLLIIAFVIIGLNLNAQSTIIDYNGYSLKFTVTNESAAECSVSCSTPPSFETELTIPSSVTIEGASYNVTSVEDYGFISCMFIGDLVIPNSVTEIGESAFKACSLNGTLTLSENLKSIGNLAFADVKFTGKLTIPNSLEFIGESSFAGCKNFTSLEFEEDSQLKTISEYAFLVCSGLSGELNIPGSVNNIGDSAFDGCEALTSIHLSNGVDTIGIFAFLECVNVKEVYMPNSVISIGMGALLLCENMESLIFEDNMQIDVIPGSFVGLCKNLKNIEIPESVQVIGNGAFVSCSSLENIEIPRHVITINTGVFSGCAALSSIKCYAENVPSLGDEVFKACPSDMKIYVPETSVESYKAASQWNDFTILPMGESILSQEYDDESSFDIYPNPASANAQINLGETFDRVEIYNTAGAKIAEYRDTDKISGVETSGVYFIKAFNDNKVRNCRIVVK